MVVTLLVIMVLLIGFFLASVDRKVEKILAALLKVSVTSDRNDLNLEDRLKSISSRLDEIEKKTELL